VTVDRTIAHYKVLGKIGEGGMGEVYRAQDTRLGRDVAIKVLPEDFTRHADRVKRFEREAQLLASLNHPHIAAIYGLEHDGSAHALVMELVEGPTLADRLARGALPVDEALEIGRQIAQALEYAHERGIVHRDLKPANIKITAAGDVKVLDFGLAKAIGGDAASEDAADLANSPTRTSVATEMGVLLGTATYMAPEQARGRPVDRRADVWAFGAVLYEMLTGARAFRGAAISEILASVMRDDPDVRALPPATPARVRELVERCLTKDVRQRLQAIGEARIALDRAIANPDVAAAGLVPAAAPARAARLLPWAVAAGLAIAAAAAWLTRPAAAPAATLARMTVELSHGVSLVPALGSAVVLSPDGRTVAFRGRVQETDKPRIFVRRLSQHDATPLAGTDDVLEIFFSRDSEWITFNANNTLKKVRVTGGDVATICDVTLFRGGDWTEDGQIVFAPNSRGALFRVSAGGGQPQPFTTLDTTAGEITHRFPQVLPGGTVLYTSHTNSVSFDEAQIVALPPGKPAKVVIKRGYVARYVPTGHLLFLTKGTLFAVPFDLDRLETTGAPVPVAEGVANTVGSAGAQFSVSNDGTLAYLAGAGAGTAVPVLWLDASGKTTPLLPPGPYLSPQFSRDGRKLALQVFRSGKSDIVVHDLERGITTPIAQDAADEQRPVWSPDGRRIVYATDSGSPNRPHLAWKAVDGSGIEEPLSSSDKAVWHYPGGWDRDGRSLFFVRVVEGQERRSDIITLPFDAAGKPGTPTVVLDSPANESVPALSPDGRWLVYRLAAGQPNAVLVRRYPELDGQVQISPGVGLSPTWSRAANELFYLEAGRRIMVVPYTTTATEFRPGKPRIWADIPLANLDTERNFDVHPDGKRLVILPARDAAEGRARTTAEFVFGLDGELRRIAAPGRR
jgi:serine/threonine-protein kinase